MNKKTITLLVLLMFVIAMSATAKQWQQEKKQTESLLKNEYAIDINKKSLEVFPNWKTTCVNPVAKYEGASNLKMYGFSENDLDYTQNGLITFNSKTPQTITRVANVDYNVTAGAFAGDAYYAMCTYQYFYPGGIYTIDLETGERTEVVSYVENESVRQAVEMSYDYTTETMYMLYASDYDAYSTAFASVDLKTGVQTVINPNMKRYVRAMAVDKDGVVYGIDQSGYLIIIDKETGECSEEAEVYQIPFYRQSMEFDRASGDLYWAYRDSWTNSTLKKVDVTTGNVTDLGKIGDGNELVVGLYIPYAPCADGAPAKVSDLLLVPGAEGALSAKLSWKCPIMTYSGDELTSIDKVEVLRNDVVVYSFTDGIEPGEIMSFEDVVDANGSYSYKVIAYNEEGAGMSANISAFVGKDVPSAVEITSVKREGRNAITLYWDAPAIGANGGYIDLSSLKYNVYRINDNKLLAEDITETQFTDNTIVKLDSYRYAIEVSNAEGTGGTTTTGYIVNGPARTLPMMSDFADEEEAYLWSVGDANADGVYFFWQYNSYQERGFYYYETQYGRNANDWLISPVIEFESGKAYKAIVTACSSSPDSSEQIEYYLVKDYNISTAIKISDTIEVVAQTDEYGNVLLSEYRVNFDNIESGEYSFAIRCVSSNAYGRYICISDVEVAENKDGNIRGDVWDDNEEPVEGVLVTVDGTDYYTLTDERGQFEIKNVLEGDYSITCSKLGYKDGNTNVSVEALKTTTVELDVVKRKEFTLSGTAKDEYGNTLKDVSVLVSGYNEYSTVTDKSGVFKIEGVYESETPYTVQGVKNFYDESLVDVEISTTNANVDLVLNDSLLPPGYAFADINEDATAAVVEWSKPGYEAKIGYYSEYGSYTFGAEDGDKTTLIGVVCYDPILLETFSWCAYNDMESANVVVLALDENGSATDNVLYIDEDAASIPYNYTTYNFSESVYAPNGCFIGLSIDEGNLSVLTTVATEDRPFIEKYNAYIEDYTKSQELNFVESLGKDYCENYCMDFSGIVLAGENAPSTTFNVYRINSSDAQKLLTAVSLEELTFNDTEWPIVENGTYTYAVEAVYKNGKKSAWTMTSQLTQKDSGVEGMEIDSIYIVDDMLHLPSQVEALAIYSADGHKMIEASEVSLISVATLDCGVYIVVYQKNDKQFSAKFMIK